jgi:hypothetical protein
VQSIREEAVENKRTSRQPKTRREPGVPEQTKVEKRQPGEKKALKAPRADKMIRGAVREK